MLLSDRKETPIRGITGLGGGIASYIFTTQEGYEISRSLRLTSTDSSYLSRTPSSVGNRKTFTLSFWIKRNKPVADFSPTTESIFGAAGGSSWFDVSFYTVDELQVITNAGAGDVGCRTQALFRDFSAWYHFTIVVDTTNSTANDRIKIYTNGVRQEITVPSGMPSQNSDTFVNSAVAHYFGRDARSSSPRYASHYLADVNFIDGQALDPTSFGAYDTKGVWQPKEYSGTYGTNGFHLTFSDGSNVTSDSSGLGNNWTSSNIVSEIDSFGSVLFDGTTTRYVRNSSIPLSSNYTVEMHFKPFGTGISGLFDTASGSSGALRNFGADAIQSSSPGGTEVSIAGTYNVNQWNHIAVIKDGSNDRVYVNGVDVGGSPAFNNVVFSNLDIGVINQGGDGKFNGRIRNVRWTNNARYTSNFTPPPVGTNLTSDSNTQILMLAGSLGGTSSVGSPVYAAADGYELDLLLDTPVNQTAESGNNAGNYCTFNPLNNVNQTLTQGNLVCSGVSGRVAGTMYVSSGKYYWECIAGTDYVMTGIERSDASYTPTYPGENDKQWALYGNNGAGGLYNDNANTAFPGFVEGDVIGHALDMDNGELSFYKNGTLMNSGPAVTGLSGAWAPQARSGSGAFDGDTIFNFGQQPYIHTPPTGFVSLCTQNLSNSDVIDGSDAMDVVTWNGNDTQRDIGGLEFSPDLVWIKKTNATSNHTLQDTIRGATKNLVPNDVQSEGTEPQYLNAFNSDGFSLGTSTLVNATPDSYIAWAWDSGTSNTGIATGDLNNTVYNQTQTWSGGTTSGDATLGGNGFDMMFNGQFGTSGQTQSSGNAILTFTTPIAFDKEAGDKLELIYWQTFNVYTSAGTVTLNGGSSATNDFRDVTTQMPNGSYTITGIGVNVARGMRISGRTLIDNGVSVSDYPTRSSTVRANQDAGFSIVQYTGNATAGETIGHGLTSAIEFMIVRNYSINEDWNVYHKGLDESAPENYVIRLNQDAIRLDNDTFWNDTATAATAFTVGNSSGTNGNNNNHIAYCWSSSEGYSAFGSYTGNGSSNGPFVYTGFKPRWVLRKNATTGTTDWYIHDTARNSYNVCDLELKAQSSDAENTFTALDIISNGFKIRTSNSNHNGDGSTYIYAAFAEHPFKTSRAR